MYVFPTQIGSSQNKNASAHRARWLCATTIRQMFIRNEKTRMSASIVCLAATVPMAFVSKKARAFQ